MFKTIRFAALAAGVSFFAVPALAAGSPVGTWATAIDIGGGTKIDATMTVSEAAGSYAVEIKDGPMPGAPADAPAPQSAISEVKVDGSNLSFKRAITTPQGAMNLTYTATVDGDAMTGQVNSDFGPATMTGTRK